MMYIGIDLGTSNSAVVGATADGRRLFKTEDGRDVLPSVIHFNRTGKCAVGTRAYAQIELAPGSVAQGFKRLMGTSSTISLPTAGLEITPEQASSEIIRALLRQVEAEAGKVEVAGAIITIPAAFNQMQSEATIRAAQEAGLERVGLLQEPVAAAMAALAGTNRKDGRFLVFDLGGGTFDVALVEAVAGSVTVIAHEGVNMLGGRDFDRAIVDSVIRPWLQANFSLPADASVRPEYKRLFAIARFRAEQAKIELSTREDAQLFIDEEEARAEDLAGAPIYVDCSLSREALNSLIRERIEDAIALCRKILQDNGLTHEDIDRIVPIGGPSKMPIIRDEIGRQLGIAVDLTIDPMTAVAHGAAIFAESRNWGDARGTRKSSRGSATSSGEIELRVRFMARASGGEATVMLAATLPAAGYSFRILGPKGYASSFKPFDGEATDAVPLSQMGENRFSIEVTAPDGRLACPPQEIVIVRTEATATAIPATQTVSVKIASGPLAERRNALEPLVKKGTSLPASGVETFKLREEMLASSDFPHDVEIYNQAEGVDDPLVNLPVGMFRLIGRDLLEPGQRLPVGSPVLIHWQMDDNGLINCEVELPDVGIRLSGKNFYVPEASHENFAGPEGDALALSQINAAGSAIEDTAEALGTRNAQELTLLRRRLARMRELLANSDDAEARRTVCQEALHIQQELARLRDAPDNRRSVMMRDLARVEDGLADFVELFDPDVIMKLQNLGANARAALAREDWSTARQVIEQMMREISRELYKQPGYILHVFEEVAEERYAAVDKALHDRHVKNGREAAQRKDFDSVRSTIGDMLRNRMPGDGGSKKAMVLASLTR